MRKPILSFFTLIFWMIGIAPAAALQPISDQEMGQVTGAVGLSVIADDFFGHLSFSEPITYTDTDGGDFSHITYVGIAGPARLQFEDVCLEGISVNAMDPDRPMGDHAAAFDASQSQVIDDFDFRPLTLDMSSDIQALCWDENSFQRSGILIGIPTLNIVIEHFGIGPLTFGTVDRISIDTEGDKHDDEDFGYGDVGSVDSAIFSLDINDVNLAFLDGVVAVMPRLEGTGVDIAMDDVRLFLNIGEIRFTDKDGQWVPYSFQYDNDPLEHMGLEDYFEGPQPAAFFLKNFRVDLLHINSLIYTAIPADPSATPEIYSPGDPIHQALASMQNFTVADMSQELKDNRGQALQIDMTSNLPASTALHQDAGGTGGIAGVMLALPTVEIYADHLFIEGIFYDDPPFPADQSIPYTRINDETSLMQIGIDGLTTAILSGKVEIAPH